MPGVEPGARRGPASGRPIRTSGSASSASCARAGYCRRPVRLRGRVDSIDAATGEVVTSYSTEHEPDGTLLKCCGNRREAVCPSCARTYRGDAFQLVASGMRGGKGVPESVAGHPMVFLTLTAPSFGPVHSRRVGRRQGAAVPAAAQAARSARTACRWPAARCMTRTIRAWASRCARSALTTSTRCCGTRSRRELWRLTRDPAPARARAADAASARTGCGCACPTSRSRSSSAAARCTSTACCGSTARSETGERRGAGRRVRHASC